MAKRKPQPLPDDFDELEEYNPPPMPVQKEVEYYVSEAELLEDTLHLYETGDFPERLALSLQRMVDHMVNTWKRFRQYDELAREEMQSRGLLQVVKGLMNKKYDPKRGSKVYSWATRVIYNEFLQVILKENKRRERFNKFAELYADFTGMVERVQSPDNS